LRRDDWLRIDAAVVDVAKTELRAIDDLRAAGCIENIDGMATPVLGYERVGDITGATMSMDGLREGETDRPDIDLQLLPIPIIHKDLSFSAREVLAARRAGTDFSTWSIRKSVRRVMELANDLLLGTAASYSFGGGTIYGYTNYPGRITKTLTNPTAAGWTPQTLVSELLDMRQSLRNKFHRGPYVMYVSTDWEVVLDDDYSGAYNGNTLRTRLQQIENIASIRSVDGLSGYQIILVQMSPEVIQEIIGMDVKVVQWEEKGGMELKYKVMGIYVPRIRTDKNSNTGIAHGVAP
jgi:uncharacterized linocin/CFP29 family protein